MRRIAVVDDDMDIGNMLQEVLERAGYGVLRAYSGTEALLLEGAADYMTKPFDTRELLARIAVQLRRGDAASPLLRHGALALDVNARTVRVAGREARLTRTEFAILKLLLEHPRQVVTRSQLLEDLSRDTPDCVESSLKVHVSNLRRKLREAGAGDMIEAVWGIGFKLRE